MLGRQDLCFLAEGLRTNEEGANQVERMLREIGVKQVVRVGLPHGAMHSTACWRSSIAIWPLSGHANTLQGRGHTA